MTCDLSINAEAKCCCECQIYTCRDLSNGSNKLGKIDTVSWNEYLLEGDVNLMIICCFYIYTVNIEGFNNS